MADLQPAADTSPPTLGRRRAALRATFVVVFLAVQLAVPAVRLSDPAIQPFGWQMFSRAGPSSGLELVHADGLVEPVNLSRYVARARPEVDWTVVLLARLCEERPEAVALRFTDSRLETRERPCP